MFVTRLCLVTLFIRFVFVRNSLTCCVWFSFQHYKLPHISLRHRTNVTEEKWSVHTQCA